jgi:hypothetical protein
MADTHVIWIDSTSRLKKYGASVSGRKSTVKIEIECDEPGSLGYLLECLGEIDRDQKKSVVTVSKAKKQLFLPAPGVRS